MSEVEGSGLWSDVETSKRGSVSWLLGWDPTLLGYTMLKLKTNTYLKNNFKFTNSSITPKGIFIESRLTISQPNKISPTGKSVGKEIFPRIDWSKTLKID